MARRKQTFQPDPAALAEYVAHPERIDWAHACYLQQPYLGGYEQTLRDARGRAAYEADTAAVLGYPSIIDRATQIAAVVAILEARKVAA